MARNFVNASGQYLSNSAPPVTAVPCTLACWYKPGQVAVRKWPLGVWRAASNTWIVVEMVVGGTVNVQAYQYDGVNVGNAVSAGALSNGVWAHIGGVFADSTHSIAYLNGVGTSAAFAAVSPTGIDSTLVGAAYIGAVVTESDQGDIAEAAIWNVALTAAEMNMLALGVSPLLIRPTSLVSYWPLIGQYSPEIDVMVTKSNLTLNGAPIASTHPRIFERHGKGRF